MPLAGEFSGRLRTSAPGLTLAVVAVLAFCCALPGAAFAAHRSHAAIWHLERGTVPRALLVTRRVQTTRRRSHAAYVSAGCANELAPAGTTPHRFLRRAVVCLVNKERARFDLPALRLAPRLTTSAQSYTSWMVRSDFFSHTGPNGNSNPGMRIAATGFRWSWAGENIASGFPTPLSVVTAWMHSQGHCYNLLAPVFADVGIGVSPHPVAQARGPATWTQDFGLPLGWNAPSGNWGPADSCPH